MKKNIFRFTSTAILAALVLNSCKNNSPYPGYEMTENGGYAKFYVHDEKGVKAKEGDILRVILVLKTDKDSILMDSRNPKFNRAGLNYFELQIPKSPFNGSFEQALTTLSVGDSASFLVNTDSLFKSRQKPSFITKGSMLTYDVKVEKITSKEEAEKERAKKMEEQKVEMELRKNEEPKIIAKYLENNKITTKRTASGLYIIEKSKGKGAKPVMGDSVLVNYTGRFLDGTEFESNKGRAPIGFRLGGVIAGWNEALQTMSAGSKVELVIPSALAYAEYGNRGIPPFTPLVFDLELLNVYHNKK